ncbi:MAG: RluA family pseudouridine synthase [Mariprofundaceae bacterium]|nr:RluA family pseudouridine synthase [Mariprofundaceae bacterium]
MNNAVLNSRELIVTIDEDHVGQRLDQALTALTGLSRNRIQKLIQDRAVYTGDRPLSKGSIKTAAGQEFVVHLPETVPLMLVPEDIPMDILFEDQYLLVVNKPAGMVIHPSHGHSSGTLVHALLYHCHNLPGINGVERPGIVHRLDKDTSGSLVVAKTEDAHRLLVDMFARHDLDRQYLAWCRGTPAWHKRCIEEPVGRHPQHRQKMSVRADGKHAITEAAIEQRYDSDFCRIRLCLHTGRTHQIRVHLSHLHLPVLSDSTYGRRYHPSRDIPEPARSAIEHLQRQALHAEVLGFTHPITRKPIHCKASLPDDLQALSEALNQSYGSLTE